MSDLQDLIDQAKAYWEEHYPTKCTYLRSIGELDEALIEAAQKAEGDITDLVADGLSWDEAWEIASEEHLFSVEDEYEEPEELPISETYKLLAESMKLRNKLANSDS